MTLATLPPKTSTGYGSPNRPVISITETVDTDIINLSVMPMADVEDARTVYAQFQAKLQPDATSTRIIGSMFDNYESMEFTYNDKTTVMVERFSVKF